MGQHIKWPGDLENSLLVDVAMNEVLTKSHGSNRSRCNSCCFEYPQWKVTPKRLRPERMERTTGATVGTGDSTCVRCGGADERKLRSDETMRRGYGKDEGRGREKKRYQRQAYLIAKYRRPGASEYFMISLLDTGGG